VAIDQLTVCEWEGANLRTDIVADPSWGQVETAVRRLDNQRFNDLYLQPDGNNSEVYLCVGGGNGRYVLAGALSGEVFPSLIDPARAPEPAELVTVGGQEGDYPANAVHDLETTLTAVRAFWSTGRFEDTGPLRWTES
jgi:hypothetical protein